MSGSVSPTRAVVLMHRLLLRQLVTKGRVIALLALGAVTVLAAIGVAVSDEVDDQVATIIEVMDGMGLVLVVPIVSLVFASASLGDTREDGTLVYLWLRPMHRFPIVFGAYLAALTLSLPLTVAPLALAAGVGGAGADGVVATVVASAVGVVAYSAVFVLLGLLIKNAIVWGLAYILLWEGVFAGFSEAIGQASVRGYARALLSNLSDIELGSALDRSTPAAIAISVGIAVAALLIASFRLDNLDVA